ncbi:hypothetical protein ACFE04_005743 [Oxalis oulophora]
MSSTKTQTLAILLLTIICSSTFIQAVEQLGAPPPKSVDMALPPVDDYALAPVDGSLFDFGRFIRGIFGGGRHKGPGHVPPVGHAGGMPGMPGMPGGSGGGLKGFLANPGLFACMTPMMSWGSCVSGIAKGVLHKPSPDFHHIGRPCCEKVLTPGTMQCIVGIMTKSFLVSMVPLPEHIKALEKACSKIPATIENV